MDFGNILNRAWKIIWKFKALWLFGILASCGEGSGGGGGGGNTGVRFSNSYDNFPHEFEAFGRNMERFFDQITQAEVIFFIIMAAIIMFVIWFIMMVLNTIGRVGLIQGTVKAESGADRLHFFELMQEGFPYFWRILGFNFLLGIAIFIAVIGLILLMLPAAVITVGIALICFIPLLCLLVPLGILVNVYMTIANNVIVNEDKNILDAAKRAWEILKDNIGNIAVMAIILAVVNFLVSIIMMIPFFFIVAPLIVSVVTGASLESGVLIGGGIASALLCLVAYIPFLILFAGILRSFVLSAWTLTYMEITGNRVSPEDLESADAPPEIEPGGEDEPEPIPDPE